MNTDNIQFDLGTNLQSVQDASLPQPPATMMVQSMSLSTSEPCGKGVFGGILGSNSCRAQEQGSSQSTSIQMEQTSRAGMLLQRAHPRH